MTVIIVSVILMLVFVQEYWQQFFCDSDFCWWWHELWIICHCVFHAYGGILGKVYENA